MCRTSHCHVKLNVLSSSSDTVYERLVNASGKTIILDSLIPRLLKEGHRVLLFCTFKIMLDILEDYFDYRGWKYLRFDGTTSQRDRTWMIDQFNQPGSEESIFMMTIRAGGLGINLQTADTVILYDSDFNPQMDIQAISRCHRIGQKRPVMVYHFVTVKSIEEGIWARAKRKRLLEKIFIDKVDEKIETADIEQLLSVASKLLFEDPDLNDSQSKVVKYDDQFIERLLDRTITAGEEEEMLGSTNSLFSFNTARVWDDESITEEAKEFWDELIQKEVSKTVCEDVLLGRGARRKNTVDYSNFEDDAPGPSKKSKSIMRDEKEYRPTSATETEESEEEVSAAVPTLSLANSKKVEAYMQDMAKPPYLVKNEPSISAPGQPLPSPAKLLPRPPINKEGVAKIPLPRIYYFQHYCTLCHVSIRATRCAQACTPECFSWSFEWRDH
jgi:superfamily II DNA/RNA helicase